jgi:hypothetical protein
MQLFRARMLRCATTIRSDSERHPGRLFGYPNKCGSKEANGARHAFQARMLSSLISSLCSIRRALIGGGLVTKATP